MIYAMSDIHGHLKQFEKMLEIIDYENFKDDDHLYVLGDVVDKGPDSIKCLLKIMEMVKSGKCTYLLGNHDHMMYDYLSYYFGKKTNSEYERGIWLDRNYGSYTFKEYLELDQNTQEEIYHFIENLPVIIPKVKVNDKLFYLCHALPFKADGIMTMKELGTSYQEIPLYLPIWAKLKEYGAAMFLPYENQTVVAGHAFTDGKIVCDPSLNYIDIDCGCAYNNTLGCLRLDDLNEYYVSCKED